MVPPIKDSVVFHHLLKCNYLPSLEDKNFLCLKKVSLLIMRDRPSVI